IPTSWQRKKLGIENDSSSQACGMRRFVGQKSYPADQSAGGCERYQTTLPAYVSRKRAAQELDMSTETFDEYVRKGVLPAPKRRGKLTRWKWAEIADAIEGGNLSVVQSSGDDYDRGVDRAKAAHG